MSYTLPRYSATTTLLVVFVVVVMSVSKVCGKYYMSLDGMKQLAVLERELADSFLLYYKDETKKLDQIQSLINDYDKQNEGTSITFWGGNLRTSEHELSNHWQLLSTVTETGGRLLKSLK